MPRVRGALEVEMPCYERRTTTVNLGRVNLDILADVLRANGARNVEVLEDRVIFRDERHRAGRFSSGALRVDSASKLATLNLKQAYAGAVVRTSALQSGWQVQGAGNELRLTRTRY
jgi:hypothetical protein